MNVDGIFHLITERDKNGNGNTGDHDRPRNINRSIPAFRNAGWNDASAQR